MIYDITSQVTVAASLLQHHSSMSCVNWVSEGSKLEFGVTSTDATRPHPNVCMYASMHGYTYAYMHRCNSMHGCYIKYQCNVCIYVL